MRSPDVQCRSGLARGEYLVRAREHFGAYALVSEWVGATHSEHAGEVETGWKDVCGESTTLQPVLEARRSTLRPGRHDRGVLPRFVAGTVFVLMQALPPAEDRALAALAGLGRRRAWTCRARTAWTTWISEWRS